MDIVGIFMYLSVILLQQGRKSLPAAAPELQQAHIFTLKFALTEQGLTPLPILPDGGCLYA